MLAAVVGGIAPAVEPAAVRRLGPYLLLEALPAYGMVQPFLARRDGSAELVVLKQLMSDLAEHRTALARFEREARVAREVLHQNLVRLVDAGEGDGRPYVVYELLFGTDLATLLSSSGPLSLPALGAIAFPVLDGLAHAHEARDHNGKSLGLVHRDLAPRNVLISFSGEVKVGDFEIGRAHV